MNKKINQIDKYMSLNESKVKKTDVNILKATRESPDYILREIMASFMLLGGNKNDAIFTGKHYKNNNFRGRP